MMPLHPLRAFFFLLLSIGILAAVSVQAPFTTAIAIAILASGFSVYAIFAHRKRTLREGLEQEARQ